MIISNEQEFINTLKCKLERVEEDLKIEKKIKENYYIMTHNFTDDIPPVILGVNNSIKALENRRDYLKEFLYYKVISL